MPEHSILSEQTVQQISDAVTGDAKTAFGDVNDAMLDVIRQTAAAAAEQQASARVSRFAQERVSEALVPKEDLGLRVQAGMAVGKAAMSAFAANKDYLDMLAANAGMVKAKFDAYVAAGFTEDQAFRLIEAEVVAKGTPGRR